MDQKTYRWSPITDLPQDLTPLLRPEIEAQVKAWQERATDLRGKGYYKEYLVQMRRRWAIETGVIERLYSLSDGATKTLIEKGLDAAYLSHEDSDRPVSQVVDLIRDQHDVIEGLYSFVSGARPLGTSYVKELHAALTRHQETYEARNTLGQEAHPRLPRGEWKKLPNNVEGPDGYAFEFCPPEHVDAETENLLRWHSEHEARGVPPYVEAAWLHHRFTLIHPFTDGNGRVARCLATLVLLKPNWFPLVVTRHDKAEYIDATRAADGGDLAPLVDFAVRLQSRAVREAFSLSEDVSTEQRAFSDILSAVRQGFEVRKTVAKADYERLLKLAGTLHAVAAEELRQRADAISAVLSEAGLGYRAWCDSAGTADEHARYHTYQINTCATALGYYANRQEYQAWANLCVQTDARAEILFSFHGMGRGRTGVLACTAMFYTRDRTEDGEGSGNVGEVVPLSADPFTLSVREDAAVVEKGFRRWFGDRLLLGLEHWRKLVGA